jgi:hypothetical protein
LSITSLLQSTPLTFSGQRALVRSKSVSITNLYVKTATPPLDESQGRQSSFSGSSIELESLLTLDSPSSTSSQEHSSASSSPSDERKSRRMNQKSSLTSKVFHLNHGKDLRVQVLTPNEDLEKFRMELIETTLRLKKLKAESSKIECDIVLSSKDAVLFEQHVPHLIAKNEVLKNEIEKIELQKKKLCKFLMLSLTDPFKITTFFKRSLIPLETINSSIFTPIILINAEAWTAPPGFVLPEAKSFLD